MSVNRHQLHLTPHMLIAAYELLRVTPPFRGWRLPDPDDVEFCIISTKLTRGTFHLTKKTKKKVICISKGCVSRLPTLISTMAHEMVHLHEDTYHRARDDVAHGARFKRLAAQVCRFHGWEETMF